MITDKETGAVTPAIDQNGDMVFEARPIYISREFEGPLKAVLTTPSTGVTRALIIGPMADSPLGPRAAEFAHATRRILESFDVEMGWIPYSGLSLAAYYLDAHLDLARLPSKA